MEESHQAEAWAGPMVGQPWVYLPWERQQRAKEIRVGGERERLLSHRPEPPKTSKLLKPRQMCSRCSFKEILISRSVFFFFKDQLCKSLPITREEDNNTSPSEQSKFGLVFFLLFKGKKPEPELCQLLFGAPGSHASPFTLGWGRGVTAC